MTSQIQVELKDVFNYAVYFSNVFPEEVIGYVVCPSKEQLCSNDFLHILKVYSLDYKYFEQDVICLFKLQAFVGTFWIQCFLLIGLLHIKGCI